MSTSQFIATFGARGPATTELPKQCARCGFDILFGHGRAVGEDEIRGRHYIHWPSCPRLRLPLHPLLAKGRT